MAFKLVLLTLSSLLKVSKFRPEAFCKWTSVVHISALSKAEFMKLCIFNNISALTAAEFMKLCILSKVLKVFLAYPDADPNKEPRSVLYFCINLLMFGYEALHPHILLKTFRLTHQLTYLT